MAALMTIPRWTTNPMPGVGVHEVPVPAALTASLRGLADQTGAPLAAILLAGHARVLAVLSGEDEVHTAVPTGGGTVSTLRLISGSRTWAELIAECARCLLAPEASPGREATNGNTETLFDATGTGGGPGDGIALRVAFVKQEGLSLQLRYRLDVLDRDGAARIAGYHLAALASLAADPDAQVETKTLLSSDEQRYQIEGLAGPRRGVPARRFHELFEERVRTHPGTIAVELGTDRLTYHELNARANRLARSLVARGVGREGVVGVATERTLGWMTAVLAIFKAGGAYLPIEPQYPAARIAGMLSRAECRLVLTERGSSAMLEQAIASIVVANGVHGADALFIDAALGEDHPEGDLNFPGSPDQLAYVYFTSGSTGLPKGVMCEHRGMVNHLFAKIDDLGIGADDVVAQIAPQCFDISMWQLVSALLVGGRTLIVEQETILDADRFLDRIAEGKVSVMQVVPSYLEVIVSALNRRPRDLPDLRCVSATGEPLKKSLVERWFALQPRIRLMNAYGLTETSDDTNHEIMDSAPPGDRVPLGRPVNNVHIYIVDKNLRLVPLGAPGEIVFSGVCVGRGYINDPERTERSYMADPYREGERLFRSGDYGRWSPDGKLEFFGRRDTQIKISGFRIEIGEIENRLLRLPGVRESAVVVSRRPDQGMQLSAFYSGDRHEPSSVRDLLAGTLPSYMVPTAFHWRPRLPLSGNGKIDRKALTRLAEELGVADRAFEPPATATEVWLAGSWAEALGLSSERIGRRDNFFDLGGTSLAAVRMLIAIERAISFKEMTAHPVLADQAELIERRLGSDHAASLLASRASGKSATTSGQCAPHTPPVAHGRTAR